MEEVERRRRMQALGQRALDYYEDVGECVFCEADDIAGIPHDPDCDVGAVSGIKVTAERVSLKRKQHEIVDGFILDNFVKEIDDAVKEIDDA